MRNLLFGAIVAALGGITLGCGSSDDGRTVVVHERPVYGSELKPAPAPVYDYELDEEFDEEIEVEGDGDLEIEIDD